MANVDRKLVFQRMAKLVLDGVKTGRIRDEDDAVRMIGNIDHVIKIYGTAYEGIVTPKLFEQIGDAFACRKVVPTSAINMHSFAIGGYLFSGNPDLEALVSIIEKFANEIGLNPERDALRSNLSLLPPDGRHYLQLVERFPENEDSRGLGISNIERTILYKRAMIAVATIAELTKLDGNMNAVAELYIARDIPYRYRLKHIDIFVEEPRTTFEHVEVLPKEIITMLSAPTCEDLVRLMLKLNLRYPAEVIATRLVEIEAG